MDDDAELYRWRDTSSQQPTLVGAGVGIFGFTAFAFIDRLFPNAEPIFRELLIIRAVIILSLAALLAVRWRFPTGRIGMACGPAVLFVICFGASYIAAVLGGTSTGYHDAVSIAMVTYAAVVPSTTPQAMCLFSVCIASYFACVGRLDGFESAFAAFTQLAILCLSGGCASAAIWLRNRAQLREIRLTIQAQAYIEQLKKSDADKTDFYANVSHELRTPLMLVLASVENIKDEVDQAGLYAQQFATANRNGLRLLHTIDDLLELSRLESSSPALRPARWSVQRFLQAQVEEIGPLAGKKEIDLVYSARGANASVLADQEAIKKVIRNLLTNALKFTPVKGRIEVTSELRGEQITVSVSDTGAGIAPEELQHVFERYYQGKSGQNVDRGGIGIGLSMCQKIVELHAGSIEIQSVVGAGTTVSFVLPKAEFFAGDASDSGFALPKTDPRLSLGGALPEWDKRLRQQSEYQLSALQAASEQRLVVGEANKELALSILIVDDDAEMLELIHGMVVSQYNVLTASDGAEGFERAKRRRPDIIISDLNMPKMDGLQMLAAIRHDADLKDIPVILMTARGMVGDRLLASELEADDFLPKPFTGKELRPILKRLLHRQHSHTEQVTQASQMAVNLAVSGLAHDIMNPVSFVKGSSLTMTRLFEAVVERGEAASLDLSEEKQAYDEARAVVRSGLERVTEAIKQLKKVAKGQELGEAVVVPITPVVQRAAVVVRANANIDEKLESISQVALKPGQLERVLLNLMLNAMQAGGDGCQITVTTFDDAAKGMAVVQVADNGPGIDSKVLAKIFEPRFSTKAGGSGLGLTMCRDIIKAHGGHLGVDSQPGRGTTFTIELPIAQ